MTPLLLIDPGGFFPPTLPAYLRIHGFELLRDPQGKLPAFAALYDSPAARELIAAWRRISHPMHILLLLPAHASSEEKIGALKAGASNYLLYPFEREEFLAHVQRVLGSSRSSHSFSASKGSTISLGRLLRLTLFAPFRLPAASAYPLSCYAIPFLTVLNLLLGLSLAASPFLPPLLGGLLAGLAWMCLLLVLQVSSSFMGLRLSWREGSCLLSLATLPIGLQFACGAVFAWMTSLSPFLLNAGPKLFFPHGPAFFKLLDFFQLWALALLGQLLGQTLAVNRLQRLLLCALIWTTAWLLALACHQASVAL